jgi:putative ABC transport system permease protein
MRLRLSELAWRNLVHDKIRLGVTLTGIVFAVVLIVVQLGLFLGFTTATSGLIDHSGADLWITAARVPYIEQGVPFSERKLSTVLGTPGVATATKYIARFTQWQRPDGRQESVQVVGFDPDHPLGGPWNVVEGDPADLAAADNIFIDEIYKAKLGVTHRGQIVEMRGHRARVVGFTRGIRSFTTSPYVFASFKSAQNYATVLEDQTVFILVKAAPGVPVESLRAPAARRPPRRRHPDERRVQPHDADLLDVHDRRGPRGAARGRPRSRGRRRRRGADDLRDDDGSPARVRNAEGDGATNGYLYRVIIQQAVISAVIGYVLAMAVSHFVVEGSQRGGAAILLPTPVAVGMLGLTLVMCIGAALVSINTVTRLDPAMVFKG